MLVACFSIAQFKSTYNRAGKPFNPILGETYELNMPQFRYFAEQVSHHPPISACHAENSSYEYQMNEHMKNKFTGRSLDIKPLALSHVRLKNFDEHYTIQRPNS